MADRLQVDGLGDLLLVIGSAGLAADLGFKQRVHQRGFSQAALTCRKTHEAALQSLLAFFETRNETCRAVEGELTSGDEIRRGLPFVTFALDSVWVERPLADTV